MRTPEIAPRRPVQAFAAGIVSIGLIATCGFATAQPAPPRVEAVALDASVARGPGVIVRLRLSQRDDGAPLEGARIVGVRAVSDRGQVAPARGVSVNGEGVYAIRAALETPGEWVIALTVAVFDRAPIEVAARVRVVDDAPAPLRMDPASPGAPSLGPIDPLATPSAVAPAAPAPD